MLKHAPTKAATWKPNIVPNWSAWRIARWHYKFSQAQHLEIDRCEALTYKLLICHVDYTVIYDVYYSRTSFSDLVAYSFLLPGKKKKWRKKRYVEIFLLFEIDGFVHEWKSHFSKTVYSIIDEWNDCSFCPSIISQICKWWSSYEPFRFNSI
jgi:hypothetical protein